MANRGTRGAQAMQYGLIAGLIAVAAITATFLVGKETNAVFFDIDSAL